MRHTYKRIGLRSLGGTEIGVGADFCVGVRVGKYFDCITQPAIALVMDAVLRFISVLSGWDAMGS